MKSPHHGWFDLRRQIRSVAIGWNFVKRDGRHGVPPVRGDGVGNAFHLLLEHQFQGPGSMSFV